MFRIKICGITRPVDAHSAVEAGADAIGLNFVPSSTRFVHLERAQEIAAAVAGQVAKVGVFVNADAQEVNRTANSLRLDWVQLHGDEPPDYLNDITSEVRILRVYRSRTSTEVIADLQNCQQAGRMPDAILVDAAAPGIFGGTGQTLDWQSVGDLIRHLSEKRLALPLLLAGGLNPSNVARAIALARPFGVDVAGGVEDSPGLKSAAKVRQFVSEALEAFRETEG